MIRGMYGLLCMLSTEKEDGGKEGAVASTAPIEDGHAGAAAT